jgi:hypothetical protein
MWGGIRNVLGHPITQGGLFQRQLVLTLKKKATAVALLFRGKCNQRLIQFAAEYDVPSAGAGFCAAGRSAAETSVSDRYGASQGIPGSLLLVVAVDPHSLDLANSKSGATQESVDQSLLLRLSLRIRDVVTLRKDHIQNNKLYLRTAKTGTKVYCPLPPTVTDALDAVPAEGKHFFWSGSSKPKSAVGDFQRSLRRLFDLAKMPHVHAHLFRHTYATDLLTAGTSMETVAALLGHSSTKVTEKSYSHWVKGRQESLETAVKNAWTHLDPSAANSP